MDLVFTGLGHLLSVIEIVIVMDFLNACLEWKNDITYKKSANIGMGFVLYLISQCNGRFQGSEIVVIIIDILILFIFCTAFFEATLRYKVLCCICPFFVITVSTILLMQIMAIITENSVIFHISNVSYHLMTGAVLSKIILCSIQRKNQLY